jgi:hypothetical protein
MDWKQYQKDFLLRTDAVWEKKQLRDYFRLYMKCFWFNTAIKNYELIEPEDLMTLHYEGCKTGGFVIEWALFCLPNFKGVLSVDSNLELFYLLYYENITLLGALEEFELHTGFTPTGRTVT